jgi:hypothetical protein
VHQLVQGVPGDPPVRMVGGPGEKRGGLGLLLKTHPVRVHLPLVIPSRMPPQQQRNQPQKRPEGPPGCWQGLGCGAHAVRCRAGRRPAGHATGVCGTVARCAWLRLHTLRPRVRARGRAERRCSWPVPSRPSSPSRPRPQSLAGPVHRPCPGPGAGKRHAGQVGRSTHRRWQLLWSQRAGHPQGRSDGPSEAGRGAVRWQAAAAWSRLGRRFGVDP